MVMKWHLLSASVALFVCYLQERLIKQYFKSPRHNTLQTAYENDNDYS